MLQFMLQHLLQQKSRPNDPGGFYFWLIYSWSLMRRISPWLRGGGHAGQARYSRLAVRDP